MNAPQVIAACAVATVVISGFSAESLPEPAHEGKPLSHWLREYETGMPGLHKKGDTQRVARAEQAVRKIGTNCFPWLVQQLSAKEATQGDALPTNFSSGEAIKRRWLAVSAFSILRPSV